MIDDPFATPLFHLVLKKARKEAELARLQPDQSSQRFESRRPIVGVKAECLIERISGEYEPLLDETRSGVHAL